MKHKKNVNETQNFNSHFFIMIIVNIQPCVLWLIKMRDE